MNTHNFVTSSVNYATMALTAVMQQKNFYHEIITGYNYQKTDGKT